MLKKFIDFMESPYTVTRDDFLFFLGLVGIVSGYIGDEPIMTLLGSAIMAILMAYIFISIITNRAWGRLGLLIAFITLLAIF